MLEKIGLPAKPSLRGSNWVVDASHCQGCSSQFTFINRKHHCRRCGGLFCNSCTQQRMVLRGQGDSPVRICEPCKKLEEAARFEMRYGHRNRTGRGSSKLMTKSEDEILNQIIGNDGKESSSAQQSNADLVLRRASSSASCSTPQEDSALSGGGEMNRSHSVNVPNHVLNEMGSTSPEELRQQALDEKKRYKILKGEGKSEEALKAFKRGKELERQADALELSIRKNRRKVLQSVNMAEAQNKDGLKECGTKNRQAYKEKDDLTAELRELGWTDADPHEDKKTVNMSLEGELSSLLGDISQRTDKDAGTGGTLKSQVVAHKRKALALKREGKLAEAKEELKKAKVIEKQLEEQELLGAAEDSDDEISVLIRSMGNDKQEELLVGYDQEHDFDFDHLMGTADDPGDNLEVTDDDLVDPEIAATLKSLGWTEDSDIQQNNAVHSVPIGKEGLLSEIRLLKKEALNQKRAGNIAEAMALLKKSKLLEKDLESMEGEADDLITHNTTTIQKSLTSQIVNANKNVDSKVAPKSRLMIQKELLALKKKALALRREGRLDEADEELKKGKVLEQQLEEMDNSSKAKSTQVNVGGKEPDLTFEYPDIQGNKPAGEEEEDVTDLDMHDPTYLSLLKNLGWKDEANDLASSLLKPSKENDNEPSVTQASSNLSSRRPKRSKGEIQRELLGLKRKALTLRREGKTDEAEEVLRSAKALETEMEEMEAPKKEIHVESNRPSDNIIRPPLISVVEEGDADDVTKKDMYDPSLLSMLKNLGWKNEEDEPVNAPGKQSKNVSVSSGHSIDPSLMVSVATSSTEGEIQRDHLGFLSNAGRDQGFGSIVQSHQSGNVMDLMTGDAWRGSQISAEKPDAHVQIDSLTSSEENLKSKKDRVSSGSDVSCQAEHQVHVASLTGSPKNLSSEVTVTAEKPLTHETNSSQRLASQISKSPLKQEVLARKRKAVALKREGKLLEAREELRQAKLLEKSLEADISDAETDTQDSTSVSSASSVQEKEPSASSSAPKPLSGRDRFKLQQQSLSHKRQALKLRREGRTEEAEAEFELAKALEAQLEEATSQDSSKYNVNMAESADDGLVEDLLDPQLLSALRAIGIEDVSPEKPAPVKFNPPKGEAVSPEKLGPVKLNPPRGEKVSQEKIQLEEQIKAEKVKAVNLKRSGKQGEALEALRRAKLYEKKLNSLVSN
ncbi:hypothetical protein JCGZ_02956 [Jatropha curcas]|uniref:FYVE-type domain-containing protein n=1 Tax=Jatropha curcas TaxID=180498 RepID=A0A067L1B2_JATCU|nr:uncharacterized protein LOC105629935 [Jatropha curcas]XP_012066980.1 uncharacterized protein LOC105629935 [Jatropha curcas]KDP42226.1 hypothetical protein JCGZ_02956 [Jatropha curcas]